jgi:hypothetical protein
MTAISPKLRREATLTLIGTIILILMAIAYFLMIAVPRWNDYTHRNVVRRSDFNRSDSFVLGR